MELIKDWSPWIRSSKKDELKLSPNQRFLGRVKLVEGKSLFSCKQKK